jgi:hypothetical protein
MPPEQCDTVAPKRPQYPKWRNPLMNLNDWDEVDPDAVHTVPDHMVADAPEDDLPTAHAGDFAPDEHAPTGEEDL